MDIQTKGSALLGLVREKPLALAAWLFAFALVYQFASNDIRYVLEHGAWQASPGTLVGRDFVNMFSAGHMMFDRGLPGIYDVNAYQAYQSALFDGLVAGHNYSYTPVSFFYVWLFALSALSGRLLALDRPDRRGLRVRCPPLSARRGPADMACL
ncbi:MAG TPA: hypothetical protein VFR52_04885, partial [Sphingomicrobium sp.]|nr:hypothetical protein [Sphingomicrobium sp.]